MPNNQQEILEKLIVFGSLFVLAPVIIIIDIYAIIKFFLNELKISELTRGGKFGMILFFVGAPIFFWFCFKHAQEKYGFFKKK